MITRKVFQDQESVNPFMWFSKQILYALLATILVATSCYAEDAPAKEAKDLETAESANPQFGGLGGLGGLGGFGYPGYGNLVKGKTFK